MRLFHRGASRQHSLGSDLEDEDELLDVQIRQAMKAAYGSAQPPEGVFLKVMRTLIVQEQDSRTAGNAPLHLLKSLVFPTGRWLAGSRIATAAVALLLLAAVGGDVQRLLSRDGGIPAAYTVSTPSQTADRTASPERVGLTEAMTRYESQVAGTGTAQVSEQTSSDPVRAVAPANYYQGGAAARPASEPDNGRIAPVSTHFGPY